MVTLPNEGVTEHGKVTPRRVAIPSLVSSFQETEMVSARHLSGGQPAHPMEDCCLLRPFLLPRLPCWPAQVQSVCLGLHAVLLLTAHLPGTSRKGGAGLTLSESQALVVKKSLFAVLGLYSSHASPWESWGDAVGQTGSLCP